ncbi:MAG: hypothetical protein KGZ52_02650 [Xanthomonadaceae bacterium]|nr:hypothetical protein [Xanthomonadaceae bacterium]
MEPGVDLKVLHEAIVSAIAAQFPALQTVEAYREETERTQLPTPACLVELFELDASAEDDPGTGQLALMARFEARLVLGYREVSAKIEVRRLAAALAQFVLRKRWGLGPGVGPAEVIGCYPDDFDPRLDQYEVMRVEWQQLVRIGTDVWSGEGVPVEDVRYAWSPRIGPPFADEYRPLVGRPPIPE